MYTYLASSWRNPAQPEILQLILSYGFGGCYDFRKPNAQDSGFSWKEIDPQWEKWDFAAYRAALDHPAARRGYANDRGAMAAADVCVLLQPCRPSAHAEAGWMAGRGKLVISCGMPRGPDLMLKLFDRIVAADDTTGLLDFLKGAFAEWRLRRRINVTNELATNGTATYRGFWLDSTDDSPRPDFVNQIVAVKKCWPIDVSPAGTTTHADVDAAMTWIDARHAEEAKAKYGG